MTPRAYTQFTRENADETDFCFKSYRAYSAADLEQNDSKTKEDNGIQRTKISRLGMHRAGTL